MNVKGIQQVRTLRGRGKRPKGLREVHTLASQAGWTPPRNRAQAATEFARLEHERERLEVELGIRAAMQQELEARLGLVHERLAIIRGMLEESPAEKAAAVSAVGAGPTLLPADESEHKRVYQTMSIEY